MKKIKFVIFSNVIGGCELYVIRLAKEYHLNNYDVELLLPNIAQLENIISAIRKENLDYKVLKYDFSNDSFSNYGDSLKKIFYLISYLTKNKKDIFHLNIPFPTVGFIYQLMTALFIKKSFFVFHCIPDSLKINLFRKFIYNNLIFKRVKVIIQNDIKKKQLSKIARLKERNINIIPNGIVLEEYDRKHNFISKNKIKLIYVGRLDYNKGIMLLLNTLLQFPKDRYTLDIYGEGNLFNEVSEFILFNKLGDVISQKSFEINIKCVYKEYDMLILPSLNESFPTVVLEAMASGILVALNKYDGANELIFHKKNGFLFDVHNSNTLCDIIDFIINDEKEVQNILNNSLYTAQRYSIKNVFVQTKALYK